MDYLSVKEISSRWNLSIRQVQKLCAEGRIQGATRVSGVWIIPTDAKKPIDFRRKKI